MTSARRRSGLLVGLVCWWVAQEPPLHAQHPDSLSPPAAAPHALVTIGSVSEDWVRLRSFTDRRSPPASLIRSPSSQTPALATSAGGWTWSLLAPEVRTAWNSDIPFSRNDGSLWAGRGLSARVMAGARARIGRVSLVLAPELAYAENRDFPLLPHEYYDRHTGLSDFASPWFGFPGIRRVNRGTIDEPLRFGDGTYALVDPGQSSLTLDLGAAALGAATENQWWGPGLYNAIVLSNHAAGVPHLFLRTDGPLRSRLGEVEAKWIAGGLTESLFFDTATANGVRSFSAVALTLRPGAVPDLTLGVARAVYASASGAGDALASAADVFTRWEQRPAVEDTVWVPETEQILSLFGRWTFPASGFEVYAEWARQELPVSLRDLLTMPNHTQGYTLGLQWARAAGPGLVRLQGESTYLEKSPTFRHRPSNAFYTSEAAPQGYTHRGQVVGAGIGPGSSSQWLAADYLLPRLRGGLFLSRIRWETEGLYATRSPIPDRISRSFHARDVSVIAGVRTGWTLGGMDVGLEYALETRYNYLFQNPDLGYSAEGAVDVRNHQLRLTVTPAARPRLPGAPRTAPPRSSPE